MKAPVVMHLTQGTQRSGLWCETCLLPSRSEVSLYVLTLDGPRQVGVYSDCDGCQP